MEPTDVSSKHALVQARYAYLLDRYDEGFLFLRPFFECYRQLGVLDDHFLYMRGLPFFGTFWGYLAAFSMLSRQYAELESITEYVTKNCTDYDFQQVQADLRACRGQDFDDLLRCRENRLASQPAILPSGYTLMGIAVIQASQASSFEDANRILREVTLTPNDFRWLEAFLQRQPMLFEPDHAVQFLLLHYQERLKPAVLNSFSGQVANS